MKVLLEPFARESIETRFGSDLTSATGAALRHYARRLRSNRRPLAVPDFRRGTEPTPGALTLELPLSATVEETLAAEAAAQGVSIDRLVSHAVFVYLSDLDGPVGEQPAESEERAAEPRYRVDGCRQPHRSAPRRRRSARLPAALLRGRRGRRLRGGSRFGKR